MAKLQQAFDANNVNPQQSTGQLPIGKHPVAIVDSIVKATQKNDGGYLELELRIMDGPMTGTTGAYRLNLYNQSAKAVEIANQQLSAICHVTGQFMIQDSAQLHNIPFIVEVGPQKDNPQYTEVKKVFDANGNEPGKNKAATPAPVQQQAAPVQPYNAGSYASSSDQASMSSPVTMTHQATPAPQQPAWGNQNAVAPQGQPAAPAWGQQPAQQAPVQQAPQWGQPQQQPQAAPVQQAPAWGQQAGGAAPWGQG
jgi:hypothetical protein